MSRFLVISLYWFPDPGNRNSGWSRNGNNAAAPGPGRCRSGGNSFRYQERKTKVSYATQEVKGAALEKAPEPNVAENLIGKVAGLNILAKPIYLRTLRYY